jgi:methylenetetrahydrofolate dehydrogenase (NADP+)/methenyltetrahydrofolate cyclohydrolase
MIALKGAAVAARIQQEIEAELKDLREGGMERAPRLAIVRVGERPDDLSYERGALKRMEKCGLESRVYAFPQDISQEEFEKAFSEINRDDGIDGILLFRPLPKQIDEKRIMERMDPAKDLDGICPVNIAKVFSGDASGFAPCTAEAVVEVLKANDIAISGKRAVIVGRSMVVGRPLSMLLLKENATVTICHTRTEDLAGTCRGAEILVAAAGKAKMMDASCVGRGAIVIDVGINVDEEGNLCGDVDFSSLDGTASMATPVPGGVGAVTTSVLAKHLVRAVKQRPSNFGSLQQI